MAKSYSYSEKVLRKKFLFIVVTILIATVLLYKLISSFLFRSYRIETASMEPTLTAGNRVATTRMFAVSNLKRGDVIYRKALYKSDLNFFQKLSNSIVAFFSGKHLQAFYDENQAIAKGGLYRIVGLPGDTIYLDNFIAYIKDSEHKNFLTEFELSSVSYSITQGKLPNNWDAKMPFSGNTGKITLGADEFFLLTDNRATTFDSRLTGICKITDIDGKVIAIIWPFDQFVLFK